MGCLKCGQPPVVMPDNKKLSLVTSGPYQGEIRVEENPTGRTETAWCADHFPSWMNVPVRPAPAPKPHIPASAHGGLIEQMRRVQEAAREGAQAARQIAQAYAQSEPGGTQ
jgi:hypothetical protein